MSEVDQRHAQRYAAAQQAVARARAQDRASRGTIVESGPDLRAGAGKMSLMVALAALAAAGFGAFAMATGEDFGLTLPSLTMPDLSAPAEQAAPLRPSQSPDTPSGAIADDALAEAAAAAAADKPPQASAPGEAPKT